jgi:hypothetical protein
MPLNPALLEKSLLNLTTKMKRATDPEAAAAQWARELAGLIHQYVLSATPTFAPGTLLVAGPGGAATNTTPLSGKLT